MKNTILFNDFSKIDIRIGTIIKVQDFIEARKSVYKITIDFGVLGLKKTAAQITTLYTKKTLIGKQILAVINLPPKQIANFMSECLILGIQQQDNTVILLHTEEKIINGTAVN